MSEATLYDVAGLAAQPLDAASQFHADHLPQLRRAGTGRESLFLLFPPADQSHDAWRLAVVQELSREAAPGRVNAVVGDDRAKAQQVADWLALQPGITGQILVMDGKTGGKD